VSEVRRSHNHPNPGPVVVVHIRHGDQPLSEGNPAHAFGPFANEDEAYVFEALHGDECDRIILDVYALEPEDEFEVKAFLWSQKMGERNDA
jgi:hypothetical protein